MSRNKQMTDNAKPANTKPANTRQVKTLSLVGHSDRTFLLNEK